MKHIYQLKKNEYQHGANLAFENAKNHFNVANKAAEIEHYGIASSLLVVAAEELAKASVLKIKSINNSIRIDNLDEYFRNHSTKHESIFKIFAASLDSIRVDSTETPNDKNIDDNANLDLIILIIVVIIGVIMYFNKDAEITKNDFQSLEDIRKAGFYLGFDQENRKWEVPEKRFSEEQYNNFRETAKLAFDTLEKSLFGDKFDSKSIIEFADKLKDEKIITEHLKDFKK